MILLHLFQKTEHQLLKADDAYCGICFFIKRGKVYE